MSELESLFLVVLAIYLVECLYWVTPGTSVFALNFRGKGKRRPRGFVWSALKTEGFLAWPLPPLSPLAVAAWPAFQLDSEGITVPNTQGEAHFLSWDELAITRTDSKLLCNEEAAFRGSENQVRAYSAVLQRLQRLPQAGRGAMIQRWLGKALRIESASRRLRVFAARSRLLGILANLQLVFLFLVAPLAFGRIGPAVLWRIILFLFTLSTLIALEFRAAHKRLFPKAGNTRLKAAVTIALSPVAAIRARDVLARDLFAGFHPVAVAAATLPASEFATFASEQLRLCRFAGHPDKWYPKTLAKLIDERLRQVGLRPEELLRPAQRESGCVAYCPQCLAQYIKDRGGCTDCGFERLVPFA
jgi:hypothetical protein